jgi:hypothetical protein
MKKLSLLFTALVCGTCAFAQIPNNSFETWTDMGTYIMPNGWDQLNATTATTSVFTCEKGMPGAAGPYYIKLTSKTVPGFGVAPGVAVSGQINLTTYQPKSGFAYTARPANLTGSWQYMAYGSDQGSVSVLLTKWNTALSKRDTVSYTSQALSGMVMSWSTFTIPLTYMTTATPDSAIIVLAASGSTPVNLSYLYVDNLAFSGTVTNGVTAINSNIADAAIFPNPASNRITVSYNSASAGPVSINIMDLNGRTVAKHNVAATTGNNSIDINTANLAKGVYAVSISDEHNTQIKKLVIE